MPALSTSMWGSIQFVTGGFTLAAFLASIVFWVLKTKIDERERLIRTAKPEQRADLVSKALEFFSVNTAGLTRQQQYELAMAQIAARSIRFRIAAVTIAVIALLLAAVSAYAISKAVQNDSNPTPATPPPAERASAPTPASVNASPQPPPIPSQPLAQCPGNLLAGQHTPRGSEPWFWELDSRSGRVRIFKSNSTVIGRFEMNCAQSRWSARLFEMTHGLEYNCIGDIDAGRLRNATCIPPGANVIDVTGIFSTAAN